MFKELVINQNNRHFLRNSDGHSYRSRYRYNISNIRYNRSKTPFVNQRNELYCMESLPEDLKIHIQYEKFRCDFKNISALQIDISDILLYKFT